MAVDREEKTEQPTERRKEEAQKKGDVPRSRDITSAVGLLLTILFFAIFMPYFGKTMTAYWKKYFNRLGEMTVSQASLNTLGSEFFQTFLLLVVPLFILLILVAFMVEIIQAGGLKIVPENVKIKWEKVFFLAEIPKGLKKVLISAEAMMELFKSIVKVTVIGLVAYLVLRAEIPALLKLPDTSLENNIRVMGQLFLRLAFYIALIMLALAVLDYFWQRHRYNQKMKMSKQDIKDEFKQAEGDPLTRARQRRIQYQWAMRRMMAEVPHADVVITNPEHYAVALKYESKKMKAPQLVAKGADLLAQKIKETAREHHVPIVENPPLARAVYESVALDEFIPAALFKPIAEVLAYIYKLKGKKVA